MIDYCTTCPFYTINGCKLSRCINTVYYSDRTTPYDWNNPHLEAPNIYCQNCGRLINYFDNYCSYCGTKVPKWGDNG